MTVTVTELANGMRVVSHAMPHLETVSLGVWVGVGTRNESASEHGISHLLEHMAFKGTARRGARDIAEEIESVGGELNAATSPETTAYFARVLKEDVPLALDIIADILQNPRYDETELAREKEVILQEIAAARDCPEDIAYDLTQEAAFPSQPLGRPIMGTAESVRGFTPADLHGYLKTRYSPGVMVLSAAGAVDHEALVRRAEAAFSALENRTAGAAAPAVRRVVDAVAPPELLDAFGRRTGVEPADVRELAIGEYDDGFVVIARGPFPADDVARAAGMRMIDVAARSDEPFVRSLG
jgi:predicted Zn-dependent peptidase